MEQVDETAEPGVPAVRPEDLRAGDADRERVLDRLRLAHVEGRLDAGEFDERITATLAARTYGELAALTDDLPGEPPPVSAAPPPAPAAPDRAPHGQAHRDLRTAVSGWAAVSVITIGVWTITCLATASFVYPWWLWVAGPWGLALLWSALLARHQR